VLSQGFDWAIWAHLSETPPERMVKTLAYLDDQYGGVEQYLMDHGLAAECIPRLRELLTEPESAAEHDGTY
jgi:Tyrosine phosphatase family